MEQIRIVKEMRDQDARSGRTGVDIRPRYMVWENVCGAFSSNKGEDFRIVLEECAKVADKAAYVPRPADGKWRTSGCIMGNGWSIAWRVLDSQFWGVPQRRRRIALVADFGGQSASEILFVRKGVSGHTEQSEQTRQRPSADIEGSLGAEGQGSGDGVVAFDAYNHVATGNVAKTLTSMRSDTDHIPIAFIPLTEVYSVENHPNDSRVGIKEDGIVQALTTRMGTGGGNVPLVLALDRASFNQGENAQYDFEISDKGIASSLVAKGPSAVAYSIDPSASRDVGDLFIEECGKTLTNGTCPGHHDAVVIKTAQRYIIRRLTPLECERLQNFPDNWTNIGEYIDSTGKKRQSSDASRYKALGNSIALPPWKWVLKRICANYERDATMASLFDGIGGFGYLWEQLNGKGSCLWASEIEEFCIAVTKKRIGGDE